MSNDSLQTLKLNRNPKMNKTIIAIMKTVFEHNTVEFTKYEYAAISSDIRMMTHSVLEHFSRFSTQYSMHECFNDSCIEDFNTSLLSDFIMFIIV